MTDRKYVRKYFRIKPEIPIHADMTIVRVGKENVSTGSARVRVLDICPGGLKFASVLNLPASGALGMELHFEVAGMDFRLRGIVAHKRNIEVGEYEYGFCFHEPDETLRTCLKKLFNNMQVRMERHIVILRFN